jgi:hypothetical protein
MLGNQKENRIVALLKEIGPARNGQKLLQALNLHETKIGKPLNRGLEFFKQLGFGEEEARRMLAESKRRKTITGGSSKPSVNRPKNFNNRIY